jgi:uncharacterized protein YuzE
MMQLTYDPRHNVAYLRLREKTTEVETIRISDALNVDIAPDGTVYGIELLNANEQLQASDDGALVVINEAVGERQLIPLTWTQRNQGPVSFDDVSRQAPSQL